MNKCQIEQLKMAIMLIKDSITFDDYNPNIASVWLNDAAGFCKKVAQELLENVNNIKMKE